MLQLDPADVSFQQDLIKSMAKALAHGLVDTDKTELAKWASRFDSIMKVSVNEYGKAVTHALVDQAFAEAERLNKSYA